MCADRAKPVHADLAALIAGLDEDEAVAEAADPGPWMTGAERAHLIDSVVYGQSDWPDHIQQVCNVDYAQRKAENAAHIARQDPDRTLRRVAAIRELLARHEEDRHVPGQCSNCFDALGQHLAWPCPDVRILTAICSDQEPQ
jgi:Family of unknown function (DUF6221)